MEWEKYQGRCCGKVIDDCRERRLLQSEANTVESHSCSVEAAVEAAVDRGSRIITYNYTARLATCACAVNNEHVTSLIGV